MDMEQGEYDVRPCTVPAEPDKLLHAGAVSAVR